LLSNIDLDYIRSVQNLSLKNLGLTKENPSVACLIVDFKNDIQGKVLSYGLTSIGGRPHAEVNALKKIPNKQDFKNSTAYISLEPCFKKNLVSCSSLLLKSGIKRIVIDSLDPNPIIHNKGFLFLKEKKIKVFFSRSLSKFKEFNKYFYKNSINSKPYITLKLAISKNGYTKDYNSKDITSKETQKYLHYLRVRHDAISVGYNTFIEDKPKLTCRLKGIDKNLKKIILFKNNLIDNKNNKFEFIKYNETKDFKKNIYSELLKLNIKSLLVEGGLSIFMAFFDTGSYDEIIISRSNHNVVSSKAKYRIKKHLLTNLLQYSNNSYGNDQIIVYKNK
jgi:diaminohydroxyphosphoribosylaminopyrimidine deaminase/5-amino-6-(5-phosphoribosylamino)uracil reductase